MDKENNEQAAEAEAPSLDLVALRGGNIDFSPQRPRINNDGAAVAAAATARGDTSFRSPLAAAGQLSAEQQEQLDSNMAIILHQSPV